MSTLPFVPCPPADKRPYLKRLKVTPGPLAQFLCVTPEFLGFKSHWLGDQSDLCQGADNGCPHCRNGQKARWSAYLAVKRFDAEQPWLLPLTAGAVQNCPAIQRLNGQLRGKTIQVSRMGRVRNSPMKVDLLETNPAILAAQRIASINLADVLCRLWGLTSLPEQHARPDGEISPS